MRRVPVAKRVHGLLPRRRPLARRRPAAPRHRAPGRAVPVRRCGARHGPVVFQAPVPPRRPVHRRLHAAPGPARPTLVQGAIVGVRARGAARARPPPRGAAHRRRLRVGPVPARRHDRARRHGVLLRGRRRVDDTVPVDDLVGNDRELPRRLLLRPPTAHSGHHGHRREDPRQGRGYLAAAWRRRRRRRRRLRPPGGLHGRRLLACPPRKGHGLRAVLRGVPCQAQETDAGVVQGDRHRRPRAVR